jgi:hypothetical protein
VAIKKAAASACVTKGFSSYKGANLAPPNLLSALPFAAIALLSSFSHDLSVFIPNRNIAATFFLLWLLRNASRAACLVVTGYAIVLSYHLPLYL